MKPIVPSLIQSKNEIGKYLFEALTNKIEPFTYEPVDIARTILRKKQCTMEKMEEFFRKKFLEINGALELIISHEQIDMSPFLKEDLTFIGGNYLYYCDKKSYNWFKVLKL